MYTCILLPSILVQLNSCTCMFEEVQVALSHLIITPLMALQQSQLAQ